jgi:YVTN family beta-propeller protein
MNNAWRIVLVVWFGLCGAQWLQASPFAYITHETGVSVVDLSFRGVIAQLPGRGAEGVAVRPDLNRAYAADDDKVSVIDARAQALIGTTGYDTLGGRITVRPGTNEAYVITDHCPNAPGSACTPDLSTRIRIFNMDTNAFGASFVDVATVSIGFSEDGTLMFVARHSPHTLSILNASTRQNLVTIPLAAFPGGVALDSARNVLYVAEQGADTVAVIDLATRALAGRITVGQAPTQMVVTGGKLFVSNNGSDSVSVVDTASRTVVATVLVGSRPAGIDATPNGDLVVVANSGSDSISVISTRAFNVAFNVAVGHSPQAIGRFIVGSSAPQLPDLLSGLWFNPAEPGWGVHVAHRGQKIFAAWFTYNASGDPKWYISSDCGLNAPSPGPGFTNPVSCSGNVYETTGPRFFSDPFNPGAVSVTKDGFFQMVFDDQDTGSMSFGIGTAVKTMPLKRQVFRTSGPSFDTNYTDLWWNPTESGWGIGITQQHGTMFLAWFAYDDTGSPTWLVASNCVVNANGDGCSGELYRTSGPIDPLRNAFDPSKVHATTVGNITASFSDANSGSLTYTVDGKSGSKQITRQLF